jgi:PAS domain S-box-containing protein
MESRQLSRQEERVLALARQGFGDKQIAQELGLSPDTVRTYWQRIRTKVGAGTRAEIVATLSDKSTAAALHAVETEKNVLLQEILLRKSVEKALRASEQQWRQLADAMPQMVFVYDANSKGIYYNARFYEFTGFDAEQAAGEGWQKVIHPECLKKYGLRLKEFSLGSIPVELECRIRRHDGEYRWHMNRAVPIRNERGRIVRWYGTCTDIHEMVVLRVELADRERALSDAETLANLGSYEWDIPAKTSWWSDNMSRIFETDSKGGLDTAEFYRLLHPDDHETYTANMGRTLATGEPFDTTYRLRFGCRIKEIHARGTIMWRGKEMHRLVGTCQVVAEYTVDKPK